MTFRVDARFTLLLYLARLLSSWAQTYHIFPPVNIVKNSYETMQLFRYSNTGELTITNFVDKDAIPAYSILSHRWLDAIEEPTFEDLTMRTEQEKLDYEKLLFCGEPARQNGLQYFWVDTCCIDKADSSELSLIVWTVWASSRKFLIFIILSSLHQHASFVVGKKITTSASV